MFQLRIMSLRQAAYKVIIITHYSLLIKKLSSQPALGIQFRCLTAELEL